MEYNNHLSKERFEEYVYSILAAYIDQTDSKTQAQLIKLYSDLHDRLYPDAASLESKSNFAQPQVKYRSEQAELFQRLFSVYHHRIKSLTINIQQIDQLIYQVESSDSPASRRSVLIRHYQSIRNRFVTSLENAQLFVYNQLIRLATRWV